MLVEKHRIVEQLDDLRLELVLHHHREDEESEDEEEPGWQLEFTCTLGYDPNPDPDDGPPRSVTLMFPIGEMEHIRQWVAGLTLDMLYHMLTFFREIYQLPSKQQAFNRILVALDGQLSVLEQIPSVRPWAPGHEPEF